MSEIQKVLVVDDDEFMRMMIAEAIGDSYLILEAGNGEECIQIAGAERPDVILLDVVGREGIMEQSQRVASQAGLPVGRWPGLSARWVWLTLLASLAVALLFSAIQLALQGNHVALRQRMLPFIAKTGEHRVLQPLGDTQQARKAQATEVLRQAVQGNGIFDELLEAALPAIILPASQQRLQAFLNGVRCLNGHG